MLISAFILGTLASLHCIGMCGPIAFMLPLSRDKPVKKAGQIFLYHSGRLFSYSLIGFLFGLLGRGINLFALQQQLSITAGALIIAGVVSPKAGKILKRPLGKFYITIAELKKNLALSFRKESPDTFFTIGFFNGLLPCGMVYTAIFGALVTADILQGALFMLLFGIGTIPLMTISVYAYARVNNSHFRKKLSGFLPVLVVLLGMLFIVRGLGLDIPYLSPAEKTPEIEASISCS